MNYEQQANLFIGILLFLLILSIWFNIYRWVKQEMEDIQPEQTKKQETIQLKAENDMCKDKLRECLN